MFSLPTLVLFTIIVGVLSFLCTMKYINGVVFPKSKACLVGKTAIITGANRGIGLEVATDLAMRGCRVILACRRNVEQTRQEIVEKTDNVNIVAMHLDLLSLDSVRKFAKRINETEHRLDILIHNAVLGRSDEKATEDGLHPLVQVSHFGPFLLTHLLVDLMKDTGPGRIVFVSSFMAYLSNLTIDKLTSRYENLSASEVIQIYSDNKLCNIMTAIGFSDRLKQHGITVNAVHPGLVGTTIFDAIMMPGDPWRFLLLHKFFVIPFAKSIEEGSYAIIDAATDERYRKTTGRFLFDRGEIWIPLRARNLEFREKIWKVSEEYVKLRPEERL